MATVIFSGGETMMVFDKVSFVRDIHDVRVGRGAGVRQMAKETGLSSSTISRLERGALPTIPDLVLLCDMMGVNPGEYFVSAEVKP